MEMKLTTKQIFVGGLLIDFYNKNDKKGCTCYQIIKDYEKELKTQSIDTQKINSVNATLASLATKELVVKSKVAYNDKMLTCYTPTEKGLQVLVKKED